MKNDQDVLLPLEWIMLREVVTRAAISVCEENVKPFINKPIPMSIVKCVAHAPFSFTFKALSESRNGYQPLDLSSAENAGKLVMERVRDQITPEVKFISINPVVWEVVGISEIKFEVICTLYQGPHQ